MQLSANRAVGVEIADLDMRALDDAALADLDEALHVSSPHEKGKGTA